MSFLDFPIEMTWSHLDWRQSGSRRGPIIECSPSQAKAAQRQKWLPLHCSHSTHTPPHTSIYSQYRVKYMAGSCSVPCLPFLGQYGSRHLLSRGLLTRNSQLECCPFAWSTGSWRRHPGTPVNIYCSNKIHHSLPSALQQHT